MISNLICLFLRSNKFLEISYMPSSFYYKSIIFALLALLLASCASKKSSVNHKNKTLQNDIVEYGKKYLNTPYKYSGKGPNSFDCSGYTSFVFSKFGYKLHSSSAGQARQGITIRRKEDLEIGDLVFFEGRSHNGRVGHVGIVCDISRKGYFNFIHASTSYGVIITSSEEPYYKARYLRGGRILKDIPKKPKEPVLEESTLVDNNYAKAQENIAYKETDNGFVAINTTTGKPLEHDIAVSTEQTSKPIKSKKKDKEKKKDESEIRHQAITATEESIHYAPTRIRHKVKPGETLYSISRKHKCSVEQLQKWNPDVENNTIKAGDLIDVYQ